MNRLTESDVNLRFQFEVKAEDPTFKQSYQLSIVPWYQNSACQSHFFSLPTSHLISSHLISPHLISFNISHSFQFCTLPVETVTKAKPLNIVPVYFSLSKYRTHTFQAVIGDIVSTAFGTTIGTSYFEQQIQAIKFSKTPLALSDTESAFDTADIDGLQLTIHFNSIVSHLVHEIGTYENIIGKIRIGNSKIDKEMKPVPRGSLTDNGVIVIALTNVMEKDRVSWSYMHNKWISFIHSFIHSFLSSFFRMLGCTMRHCPLTGTWYQPFEAHSCQASKVILLSQGDLQVSVPPIPFAFFSFISLPLSPSIHPPLCHFMIDWLIDELTYYHDITTAVVKNIVMDFYPSNFQDILVLQFDREIDLWQLSYLLSSFNLLTHCHFQWVIQPIIQPTT